MLVFYSCARNTYCHLSCGNFLEWRNSGNINQLRRLAPQNRRNLLHSKDLTRLRVEFWCCIRKP